MTPVDIETFLYGKDYMNLSPDKDHPLRLSDEQMRVLRELDDDNPDTNKIIEAVLVWGKGSGKDWITSIFFCRRVYKLLCLANPQKFYGMPAGEPMEFLNVAVSAEQANSVFFFKLTNMIKEAGPLAFKQFGFDKNKDILSNKIIFPKSIILHSGHSEQASLEGKNLFAAVMDEAAEFKTEAELRGKGHRAKKSAPAIYRFLASSIRSRFPTVGKLIIISYPRFANDFILQRYEIGKNAPDTLTSFGTTWEINPLRKRDDFNKDYRENPEQARSQYECVPPMAKEPFIRESEKVDFIIDNMIKSPYDLWGTYYPEFRGKPYSYAVGVDLALTGDRVGFALTHKEQRILNDTRKDIVVLDLLKTWEAEPGKEIDLDLITKEILFLRSRGFNIIQIFFDQFQSAHIIQQLRKLGFAVDRLSIETKLDIWNSVKTLIYNYELKTYKSEASYLLIEELKGLSLFNGKKVDHTDTTTKDLSDAVVRAIHGLVQTGGSEFVFKPA